MDNDVRKEIETTIAVKRQTIEAAQKVISANEKMNESKLGEIQRAQGVIDVLEAGLAAAEPVQSQ